MDKLAINMKAAKLCGLDVKANHNGVYYEREDKGASDWMKHGRYHFVDIFTNPADREATVIALGEKRGIGIAPDYKAVDGHIHHCWKLTGALLIPNTGWETYIEALAAAVDAV